MLRMVPVIMLAASESKNPTAFAISTIEPPLPCFFMCLEASCVIIKGARTLTAIKLSQTSTVQVSRDALVVSAAQFTTPSNFPNVSIATVTILRHASGSTSYQKKAALDIKRVLCNRWRPFWCSKSIGLLGCFHCLFQSG
eukprot:TRINITY_DN2030_c0_g1_i2.p1 TRINITY_DN2030_c0_g1~~TRINITY_DN2030_c0_g1_i2.p1  ORF type:complete len:140 (-),score=4.93 TRINITY_DN2030_c0_g1_i2:104-523(-)